MPNEEQNATDAETTGVSRREVLKVAAIGAGAGMLPFLDSCSTQPPNQNRAVQPQSREGTGAVPLVLDINGVKHDLQLDPRVVLLDALREHLALTGTKKGCDHGQCGACTVLMDGTRVNSCLLLAVAVQGRKITTIEGIADGENLHPVQAAFIEHDAFQCGYCTPGQICSAVGLINEGWTKTEDDIREGMSGNLCRCAAYPNIVAAVKQAMDRSNDQSHSTEKAP